MVEGLCARNHTSCAHNDIHRRDQVVYLRRDGLDLLIGNLLQLQVLKRSYTADMSAKNSG